MYIAAISTGNTVRVPWGRQARNASKSLSVSRFLRFGATIVEELVEEVAVPTGSYGQLRVVISGGCQGCLSSTGR